VPDKVASEVLLDVSSLSKSFGGTLALKSIKLQVRGGQLHALLGENGAGKSTLIKILAGVYAADVGVVTGLGGAVYKGQPVAGVSFVHQDLGLIDTMTVAENIALGAGYARRGAIIDWSHSEQAAKRALAIMNCDIDPRTLVGRLTSAEKSMVAIARALQVKADVLVLDEPTATLSEVDVVALHEALRRLRASGMGILYVTHRLDEVFRIADHVTVLRDGKLQSSQPVASTDPAGLIEDIVGRRMSALFPERRSPAGQVVLGVKDLVSRHVGPASFDLRSGEILALVGLRGAGQDVIGRIVAGAMPALRGTVTMQGKAVNAATPRDAIAAGIGFVSSKRREESIYPGMVCRENLFPDPPRAGFKVIGTAAEVARAREVLDAFDVRPRDTEKLVSLFSGGNQQKLVIARWLAVGLKVVVLEEPTIGVDVGAKVEIYSLLRKAVANGLCVLLISSDFEEVAGLCDRALVFNRGRIVRELLQDGLSPANLTAYAAGAAA
jgi:ribose transport system ATP-binding protein